MKKLLLIALSFFVLTTLVQAQKKISELPVATSVASGDLFVIVNAGATKKLAASRILDVMNDTADVVRAYVDDKVDNIEMGSDNITNNGIYVDDMYERAGTYMITSGGPKIKTTTSAGDSIVKSIHLSFPVVGDIIEVKACFHGVGVGKMMVYNFGTNLDVSMSTPTLNIYSYGYIEAKIIPLTATTFGVEQRIYDWDDYNSTFTNTNYRYSIHTYDSYPEITVRIKYNSTTIGFQCLWYTAEYKPMHPGYSNDVDTN